METKIVPGDQVKIIDVWSDDVAKHRGKVAIALEPYGQDQYPDGWRVRMPEDNSTKWFLARVKKYVKHNVELTDDHLQVIAKACELYTRVHLGQIDEVADEHEHRLSPDDFNQLRDGLRSLKPLITKQGENGSFGITGENVTKDAKLAYEVWRTIEERNNQKKGWQQSDPLELSGEEMPKIH